MDYFILVDGNLLGCNIDVQMEKVKRIIKVGNIKVSEEWGSKGSLAVRR